VARKNTPRPRGLSEEELRKQKGEPLPDREAMSIVTPGFERPMPLEPLPDVQYDEDPGSPLPPQTA